MENPEVVYNQLRDEFIRTRTRQEQIILTLGSYVEKVPAELRERLPKIDHDFTLKGFIPALYDETVDRKSYSEQLHACNKYIEEWNKLVDENDAEAAAILDEMRKKGI